jgi:diguanylate cyclase (GGDEF)-like protein
LEQKRCICDYFFDKKGFFSLNDIKDKNINWIEALLQLPPRKRIVSMKDAKDNIIHAFSVSINKYDKKSYIISFNDISDTIEEKLELEKEMVKDKLTLAYNRTYFDKNINRLIKTHKAQNLKTGIIFFDIDFFKNINDTFGHDKGDEVLKDLVKIIKYHIRHSDKLIRWGGEEFLVIAPVHNMDELYIIAEHLRKSVEEFNFGIRKQITCSFGLAVYDENENISVTIKRADERLYKAKKGGRNRVVSD